MKIVQSYETKKRENPDTEEVNINSAVFSRKRMRQHQTFNDNLISYEHGLLAKDENISSGSLK